MQPAEQQWFNAAIAASSPNLLFCYDTDANITWANAACCRKLGYAEDALTGIPASDTIHPDWRARFTKRFAAALAEDEPVHGELRLLTAEGDQLAVNLSLAQVTDGSGKLLGATAIATDITPVKLARGRLREARELFNAVAENSQVGIAILQDSVLEFCNSSFSRLVGKEAEELKGAGFEVLAGILHPDDRGPVRDRLGTFGSDGSGQQSTIQCRLLGAGTGLKWIRLDLSRIQLQQGSAILAVATDLTEMKNLQESWRQETIRARNYLNIAGTMIIGLDPHGHIALMNRKAAQVLGVSEWDLAGCDFYVTCVAAEDAAQARQAVAELAERPLETGGTFEFRVRPTSGGNRAIRWAGNVIRDELGRMTGVLLSGEDVTAQLRLEREFAEYHDRLRELTSQLALAEERERQRLAVELHDRIGHALVLAKMKLSGADPGAPEELDERLAVTMQLLQETIEDTRSLTFELSPPILKDVGLAAALEWLVDKTAAEHEPDGSFAAQERLPQISPDLEILLFQATRELLFNMVKHARAESFVLRMWHTEEELKVSLTDDGCGFDPQAAFRKRGAEGGYGLMSINERMNYTGGKMRVESAPGEGAVITLIVPLRIRVSDGLHQPPEHAAGGRVSRVLIVDDQRLMQQGLRTILEREPDIMVVGEAGDGEQALEFIDQQQPDVLLMDIEMPGMGGIATTREVVKRWPGLKVVALSNHAGCSYITDMLTAGARGYLLKDCASEDLANAIRAVDSELMFISPQACKVLLEALFAGQPATQSLDVLTAREREVLELLVTGNNAKEIALTLGISNKTVHTYRSAILGKLGFDNVADLTRFAMGEGLINS